ncbi:MAG: hypothetical protein NTZ83_01630, partial [Candidatus Pacearchaeota archaeon]|nr:hypothetical protein [Candidatus Pacearchaeota archaeon]
MKQIYQSFEVLPEFRDFACGPSNQRKRERLQKANSIEGKLNTWIEGLHLGIQNLRYSLSKKGYEILESSDVLFGVPGSIIIGSDFTGQ